MNTKKDIEVSDEMPDREQELVRFPRPEKSLERRGTIFVDNLRRRWIVEPEPTPNPPAPDAPTSERWAEVAKYLADRLGGELQYIEWVFTMQRMNLVGYSYSQERFFESHGSIFAEGIGVCIRDGSLFGPYGEDYGDDMPFYGEDKVAKIVEKVLVECLGKGYDDSRFVYDIEDGEKAYYDVVIYFLKDKIPMPSGKTKPYVYLDSSYGSNDRFVRGNDLA